MLGYLENIKNQRDTFLLTGMGVFTLIVFAIDVTTPTGKALGVLYIIPMLASLWLKSLHPSYLKMASMFSFLILIGYIVSPLGVSIFYVIFNRALSLFLVCDCAFCCDRYRSILDRANERKKLLEDVFYKSFDSMIKIDSNGLVISWNRASQTIFGWSYNEIKNKYLADFIIPARYREAHAQGIKRFLKVGDKAIIDAHIEITALRKNGDEFPVELTISAIEQDNSYVFTSIIRDITQKKQLEAQNQAYAYDLAESLKQERVQKRALEIANTQLSVFSKQAQDNLLELENAYLHTLNSLSLAAEYKDEDTGQHLIRISRYCRILGKAAGLGDDEVNSIILASPMHDIGKVGIPDIILQKKDKLTQPEFDVIKEHTLIGAEILGSSCAPIIVLAREIALSHHEKWSGAGYPNGIGGEKIPLAARIVGLVDCFDALTSERPYKAPYPVEMAFDIIVKEKEKSFDPYLVECFIKAFNEFKEVVAVNAMVFVVRQGSFQLSGRDKEEQKKDEPWWSEEFPNVKVRSEI